MKSRFLFLLSFLIILSSCARDDMKYLNKDYLFEDNTVTVTSCPNGASVFVNDQLCVTPCIINVPYNSSAIKVSYNAEVGYVPVASGSLYNVEVKGILVIPDLNKIGVNSSSPQAPFLMRDLDLTMASICGYEGNNR